MGGASGPENKGAVKMKRSKFDEWLYGENSNNAIHVFIIAIIIAGIVEAL